MDSESVFAWRRDHGKTVWAECILPDMFARRSSQTHRSLFDLRWSFLSTCVSDGSRLFKVDLIESHRRGENGC